PKKQVEATRESESKDCKPMDIDEQNSQADEPALLVGIQEATSHLCNPDWKMRKNALDSLTKGINSNSFTIDSDMFSIIREKLSDSNKSIVVSALELFSAMCFCESCKELLEKNSRTLVLDVLNCFSDAKESV